jgi:hypothetical protein
VPIQIASFSGREQKATVEYQGDTAEIVFLPNSLTPNRVQHVQNNSEDIDVLAQTIAEIVLEWDVIGDPPMIEDLVAEQIAVTQGTIFTDPGAPISVPVPAAPVPFTVIRSSNRGPQGMYPLTPAALVFLPIGFLSAVMTSMFEAISPKSTKRARS